MTFAKKYLSTPKRVCLRLKESREARGLTIADIARLTRIEKKYIEAMEDCRFGDMPAGTIYQKNFIKLYAHSLDMTPNTFLDQFIIEEAPAKRPALHQGREAKKNLSARPITVRAVALSAMIGLLMIYLTLQIKQSIDPPRLTLFSPTDGLITNQQTTSIQGETEHETQVSVNGQAIIAENNGRFKEQLYLAPGINTIIVSAKRKHGKTTTATRHVILKDATLMTFNRH